MHKYPYKWTLKDANFTKDKGKVFSCFACGGGSTMGYKLAGFDVIGCNEIDPKMIEAYKTNHNPKYAFLEPIQTFKNRADLPEELYNLDILDGSPPCSNFSMAGNREKDWGKEKKFREGQSLQVLDTLFFDFIDLAKKLQPKIVIAENVKGLLLGNAITYVREIYRQFDLAGYYVQHFLLDASKMGVPQRRERVFFIALRKDLATHFLYQKDIFTVAPKLELKFDEPNIEIEQIEANCNFIGLELTNPKAIDAFFKTKQGQSLSAGNEKGHYFNWQKLAKNKTAPTLTATHSVNKVSGSPLLHYELPNEISYEAYRLIGTFPFDYNFLDNNEKYLIGMSVPPVMVAQIAGEIYIQWLAKIHCA